MKNLKLLLATTAMLSTGLMVRAMAYSSQEGANVSITPKVKIIAPLDVESTQELTFGTLINPKINDTVRVDLTGETATGSATLLDKTIGSGSDSVHPSRGNITAQFNSCIERQYTLDMPEKIALLHQGTGAECGEVTFIKGDYHYEMINGGNIEQDTLTYGGEFKVTGSNLTEGLCTNTVTVTVIRETNGAHSSSQCN